MPIETTAELLADIGAIDASLLSVPVDDLDRIHFYVIERDKLLERLRTKVKSEGPSMLDALENVRCISESTHEIRERLDGARQKLIESLQLADAQLRQIEGFRRIARRSQSGSVLSRIA